MEEPRPTLATGLAEYAQTFEPDRVPEETARHVGLAILDTVGAGLHAHGSSATQAIQAYVADTYGRGEASIWGTGLLSTAAGAALSNGTSAHENELDDYVAAAKVHPGAVIVPAALAVSAPHTSGRALFSAVAVGYEVMVRVARALDAPAVRKRGYHVTGVAGPLGATVAAGCLMGLSSEQLAHAMGIAGSRAGGLFAFTREGSMTKCLHAGMAAEAGVMAAMAAAREVTGPSDVFEAADGGLLGAFSDVARPEALIEGLGTRYAVDEASFKPYPCCAAVHSSIDAALGVRDDPRFDPGDVVSIGVGNSTPVVRQCGFTYTGHGGALEARLSLQFCVAVALLDGRVELQQFTAASRDRTEVRELASRVGFEIDPEIERTHPEVPSAWVEVRLRSGAVVREFIEYPLGNPERPMSGELVIRKFHDATSGRGRGPALRSLPARLADLRSEPSIDFLAAAVRAG